MRKILVTGAAGFIGSELVAQLAGAGDYVVAVDNLANGRWENLEGVPEKHCLRVTADIRDERKMAELMSEVEVVFHLACLGVRHSIHAQLENHDVNATGTLLLLELAHSLGVGRFVYVSSSEVYGTARWVPMTEEHPTAPNTVYGASKLAGECYTRAYFETYRYPTVVIRPFNTYGPRCHHEGDCGEVMPKFLLRSLAGRPLIVFGDGAQTRDFTFVSDTARGIIMTGLTESAVGQTINIGSGREVSVNELAQKMARAVGLKRLAIIHDEERPGDVRRLFADSSRAKALCGFEPRVGIEEGLVKLRDWYLSLGESPEELLEHEVVRNWEQPVRRPAPETASSPGSRPEVKGRREAKDRHAHPNRPSPARKSGAGARLTGRGDRRRVHG
jgi:UDP-glucose 4-epimerase